MITEAIIIGVSIIMAGSAISGGLTRVRNALNDLKNRDIS
jgi:hypothetical protein